MDTNLFLAPLNSAWLTISPLLLNLLSVLVLLLIGFLVAKVLGWVITFVLEFVRLDKGAKRIGFASLLEKGDIKKTTAELTGELVYWAVVFVTIISVAKAYGLPIDSALGTLLSFLGLVFVAAIVLGVGLFFASFLAGIIRVVAANFGVEGSKTLSRVIYYVIVIFVSLAALAQLGIKTEVFAPQIGVIIGAVGLAAAIAFGLGCKDMAADFLHNLFKGK